MADKNTRIDRTDTTSLIVNEGRPRTEIDPDVVEATKPPTQSIVINHEEQITPPNPTIRK